MAAGQGKRIPDEKKAVVIAALLEGQSVSKVSEDYKVPASSVSRLRKLIPQDKLEEIGEKKGDRLAELISGYLETSFKAITNVLNQTNNADWLKEQSASELATFIGVASDKIFRVLEAIDKAQSVQAGESE
jgi:transposase-like protein